MFAKQPIKEPALIEEQLPSRIPTPTVEDPSYLSSEPRKEAGTFGLGLSKLVEVFELRTTANPDPYYRLYPVAIWL